MQLSRLFQFAILLRDEFYRLKIAELIQHAASLAENRPSYRREQYLAEAQQVRREAERVLEESRLKNISGDLLNPVRTGRLSAILPERIGRMILAAIPESDPHAAAASPEISMYLTQANFVLNEINGFIAFAEAFGVEHYKPSGENITIELSIPRASFKDKLDCLGTQLIEFEKLAEPVSELLTGNRSSPDLLYITTSDPIFILEWLPVNAIAMLTFYKDMLGIAASSINITKTIRMLTNSGASESTVKEIKGQLENAVENQTASVIDSTIKKRANNITEGRANELRKEIEIHARVFVNDIAKGTRITINIDTRDETELVNANSNAESGLDKTTELIESTRNLGDSLWSAFEDIPKKLYR